MRKKIFRIIAVSLASVFSGLILFKGLYLCFVTPSWDESVYILMGKYLFSLGKVGLWESFRPPLLPVFLGAIWKAGLDPVVAGRLLLSIVCILVIYQTYRLGSKIFGRGGAIFSVIFLGLSPVFIAHANAFFSEIPSTLLGLLGVSLWLNRRLFLCGVACALAFLTRFPQGLLFAAILFTTALFYKKYRLSDILALIAGFLVITCLFLLLNVYFYGDLFGPFISQAKIIKAAWRVELNDPAYYAKIFIKKENIFLLFFFIGAFFSFRNRVPGQVLFCLISAIFVAYFNSIVNMIPRYLIIAMPYVFSVSGYGLFVVFDKALKKHRWLLIIVAIPALIFLAQKIPYIKWRPPEFSAGTFEKYVGDNAKMFQGRIWISDPSLIVYSDLKPAELMYYFDCARADYLTRRLDKVDWIFLRPLGLFCLPSDSDCLACSSAFIDKINKTFVKQASWREEYHTKIYESVIYKRKTF